VDEAVLPPEYQRVLASVRQAAAPAATRPSARRWACTPRGAWQAGAAAGEADPAPRAWPAAQTARRLVRRAPL